MTAFLTNVGMRYPVAGGGDGYVESGSVVDDVPPASVAWLLDQGAITPKWLIDLLAVRDRKIASLEDQVSSLTARLGLLQATGTDVAVGVGAAVESAAPAPAKQRCVSFYEAVKIWLQGQGVFDVAKVISVDAEFDEGRSGSTYTCGDEDTEELAIRYVYKSGVEGVYHHECFLGDFISELASDEGGWEA